MSPYERRRGGNAPPGGSRGRPGAGNARSGQRGSGHSVATRSRYAPDTELGYAGPASWRRGEANSTASGRRVCQHRSFAPWGKARPEKWAQSRGQNRTREIRPSGIVEGLQETWPVGALFPMRRARLISISTSRSSTSCSPFAPTTGRSRPRPFRPRLQSTARSRGAKREPRTSETKRGPGPTRSSAGHQRVKGPQASRNKRRMPNSYFCWLVLVGKICAWLSAPLAPESQRSPSLLAAENS